MNQVFLDDVGNIVCIPTIEPYYRNAVPPPRRPPRPRRPSKTYGVRTPFPNARVEDNEPLSSAN